MNPAVQEVTAPAVAEPSMVEKLMAAMSGPTLSAEPEAPAVETPAAEEPAADEEFTLPGIDDDAPPAAEEAPPTDEAPAEGSQPVDPKDIDSDIPERVVGAFMASSRGKRVLGAFKTLRDVSKLPDEGGIGFIPTVGDIKEFHAAQQDWIAIQKDFSAPEPESKARFLDFWLGPDQQGRIRPGAEELAEMLPVYLNEKNPQAFQRLSRPMYEGLATRFMELSKVSADPEESKMLAAAADLIARDQLGRPLIQPADQPQGTQLPADVQRELDELRRFRQSQQQQQQTSAQQQQTAFSNDIDARCDRQLLADVEEALKPAAGVREANGFVYEATKAKLVSDLKAHLQRNTTGMSRVEFAKSRAVNSRDPQMAGAVIQEQRRLYIEPLRQLRGEALKALGVTLAAKSAATADQRNLSAGKTAPTATTAVPPAPPSSADPNARPGESTRARLARLMSA